MDDDLIAFFRETLIQLEVLVEEARSKCPRLKMTSKPAIDKAERLLRSRIDKCSIFTAFNTAAQVVHSDIKPCRNFPDPLTSANAAMALIKEIQMTAEDSGC
ncbi:hypothetical protein [Azospirillum rugosum]|uniref:HEPN domain-containing protein n=1 Tax=Azospirillum rugosum TaxID=416170 RepID=A0ABS4SI77_9PROT|nr:hypothetical protein [Azospirillum rugosum]MBP2291115.1 hypothetical protein [Azospirillum rugosum]MDQ0524821.1 hypothetical protein [Azospirillum rugosum]